MFSDLKTRISEAVSALKTNNVLRQEENTTRRSLTNDVRILTNEVTNLKTTVAALTEKLNELTKPVEDTHEEVSEEPKVEVVSEAPEQVIAPTEETTTVVKTRRTRKSSSHERWQDHEDETLINMCNNGTTFRQLYDALPHRTDKAIQQRVNKLEKDGLIFQSPTIKAKVSETSKVDGRGKLWSPMETNTLRTYVSLGYSDGKIASTLGRTRSSVSNKIHKMGLRK